MTVESRPRTPQKTKRPAATLHVLVYPESGRMVAHVLETDTVSDGETPAAALRSVGEALRLEFAFDAREPNAVRAFETPAPTACWIALKSARLTSSTRHVLPELGATTLLAYRIDEAPRADSRMTERPISYRDLAARLRRFGCVEDSSRGKGGHRLWVRRLPEGRLARCAVPFHGPGSDVPPGILRSLRRRLGLALPDGVTDDAFYGG